MPAPSAIVNRDLVPAVFLDKDGTLVENVPYNVDIRNIRFYPEVLPVLAELAAAGYKLIVVSNQPGVAHGYFDEAAIEAVKNAVHEAFAERGIPLSGFYFCPHHPQGRIEKYAVTCECRKPRAGLIERAAKEHYIDTRRSWMVGDILDDIEAGNRAGCRTVLVDRGNETEWEAGPFRQPDWVVSDLGGMTRYITGNSDRRITNADQRTMSMKT